MNLKLKQKWLYAIIIAACVLVAAAVTIFFIVRGGNEEPDDGPQEETPGYTGGAEQGEYYYDVANGEVSLTLTKGNFTLKGPDIDKAGTYSVDGTTMALDFAKDEDGTATATISGNTITLTYRDAKMTFLKKVKFTVSFNANGGSAVAPVEVINGKPASKPQDPTKDEHVFLGWYTDSALTTSYAFTTPVTADITLYAKWIKDEGGVAYNVSFDLGYEGAPVIDDITTVNGIAYNLPENPTRDGFTFAGWWVSMFEDGEKLTYKYTGTVLKSDTTLFALWTPDSAQLAAPEVNVNTTGISWTPVPGATSYRITVLDGEGNVLNRSTTVSYSFSYNFTNRDAGTYVFEVVAVGTGSTVSEAAVRYYSNKALDRVSGLEIVDGKLIFDAVENAEKYIITIDCGNKLHNHDALDNGASTYFDFSNCSMQKGGIKFSVVAAAEGYASSVASRTLCFEQSLASVGNLTYDSAIDSFTWNAVDGATEYKVAITVGGSTYTFNVSGTSFGLASYTGAIAVEVTAVADGYNSSDAASASTTKTAPAIVQNLTMSNTTLTWSADAASYVIKINGKEYTTTETTFDLASKLAELNLEAGATYTVSVIAVDANGNQSVAVNVSAISGAMSTELTYSDKVVYWPAVIGADNFLVRVNGGEPVAVSGKSFASIILTKAGENTIEVICSDLTTDWTNAAKIVVTAYTVKYATRTITGGEVTEYLAVGDSFTFPTGLALNGYNFDTWYNTPLGAEDNGKAFSAAKFYGDSDLTIYTNWIPKSYKVTLNVDNSFVSNVPNGTEVDVTYTKDFTLPVPVSTDESKGFFVGWFNAPNGGGIKMTDDLGNSVEPYGIIGDSVLYPYFAQALSYIEVKNSSDEVVGYYVTKGLGISNRNVSAITIPTMYNGKPIIGIADNAFHSCYNIVSVDFPNTVEYVGKGAFELCNNLVAINMYDADNNPATEPSTPYSTHDGALMCYYETSNKTYLEVFPSAKIGEYTTADNVDVIGPGAFRNARVYKVIISKNVTTISKNAFINCSQLTEIEFAFEREKDVAIEDGAFADTPNVTTLILPAKLALLENIKVFDAFEDLSVIRIEGGGAYYSSVDNLICDPHGTKLLYVPRSFKGTFEVPLGITSIDDKLFYQNPYITGVIIGEHVETIGSEAFYACTKLTSVVIKTPREALFTIGAGAFNRCTNLKTVTIEGSDVSDSMDNLPIWIGDNAFSNCSKLTTVTVGKNATIYEIGPSAFSFCTALESFTVDADARLQSIGNQAFLGCTSITKFEIHGTTKSIGNNAFEGCSKLNTISLGENIGQLSLGKEVFKDCKFLVTINLPASLVAFDSSLFDGCESIQNINVDSNNTYLDSVDGVLYTEGCTEIIYFPRTKTIENGIVDFTDPALANLKKIGPTVFRNNPNVVKVIISAGIEQIAKGAFENCLNLTEVVFAGTNDVFTVDAYAFAGCSKLTAITLPAATDKIGSYAFDHSALASITIPASATYIGYNAFAYTNLTEITIPANVTYIGHGAFFNASKLNKVTFAPRTEALEIGQWDDNDAKADDITFNELNGTFAGTALTTVEIPATATYLGKYAFSDVTTLATVTIPSDATLTTIDAYAFKGTGISSIILNEGLTTIGEYAFADTKLETVNIPKTVQYIKGHAFSISTLTSITFDEGSNQGIGLHISNGALAGANLTSIHLPAQLKAFGEAADRYGYTAISVFYDSIPVDGFSNFKGNTNLSTITVSPDSTTFGVVDGVLYKIQGVNDPDTGITSYVPVRLLFSPIGNTGNSGTVTIPKTVTMVDYASFIKTHLTQIIFEEYATDDPKYGQNLLTIGYLDSDKVEQGIVPVITSLFDSNTHYTNLTLIQFPSHLGKIRNGFLSGFNAKVANTVLKFNPDSSVEFGGCAMRNNSAIKRIELPKLKAVKQYSFYGFSNLTELVFTPGSTVTDIGYRAFEGCSKLTSFVLPASVKTISEMAFYNCSSLTSFTVEDDSVLESIGNKAFQSMASQTNGINFVIPAGVTAVGTEVFKGAKIIELTLSENIVLDSNGSLIEGCTTIEKIHVPGTHATLSSFDGIVYDKHQTAIYMVPSNWNEDQFIIPDTVQVIAAGMFANFKGSYVKLPAALTEISSKAFQYANITHIEIPDNVVSIGDYAFNYCQNLTTITISANSKLKYIGAQAFSHTAITSINLPDSVDTIGYSAFEYANKLGSIKLPMSLKTIESSTFKNCTALTSIELNEGLETIGNSAFVNCAFTEISIPNSVTRIIDYSFNGCKNLKTFTCTEFSMLSFVGFSCFYNCSSLETVTFGPLLKNFGYNAQNKYNTFYGCSNLKEINLPRDMVEIPNGFFSGLQNLEAITLPEALETLGAEAFYNCPKIRTITIPATLTVIDNAAFAKCTALESVVFAEGSKITIISANAFAECTALASINLPEGLIEISDSAFAKTAFVAITLPSTLEEIGTTAFYGCDKLTAIEIPASVLTIGNEAFENCTELVTVTLNSGIKNIGSLVFAKCTKLATITIPNTVGKIDGNPFVGCPDLVLSMESGNDSFKYEDGVLYDANYLTIIYYSPANTAKTFTVPTTVIEIENGAFANAKLETLNLGVRITAIPAHAFNGCTALKNVTIPDSVTTIGDSAFVGCSALESLTIPAKVTSIGSYAFANCSKLSTFTLAERKDNITVGSYLFYGCASITEIVEFPGVKDFTPYMYAGTGITSITFADNTNYNIEGVFADSALTTVTFGKLTGNINAIGKAFFAGTKIVSITIPEGFHSIGDAAFKGCENLVSVTFSATSVGNSAFENCTSLTTVIIARPSYLGPRDEFQVNLANRAFANDTALSTTNLFDVVYSYGKEALLNCTSIKGEVSLSNKLGMIDNYAFSGMTLSKITVNGREFYLQDYSFAGLTEATTIYFATAQSAQALTDRMGGNTGWFENATAKLEFFSPNSGEVVVTLTAEEEKWLESMVEKGEIDKSMMDAFKEAWLNYKGSFITLYPSTGKPSKDEVLAVEEFCATLKIGDNLKNQIIEGLWSEYKQTLAKELTKHPKYFTAEELELFEEIMAKGVSEEAKNALKQAWFEYKISFNEANPSDSISKEEAEPLYVLCAEYGIPDGVRDELINQWPAYKKVLAAALKTPVYIDLTEEETKNLENFLGSYGIKDGLEDIKLAWMAYKGGLVIEGKGDAEALTAEEEALVDAFVATYGLDAKLAGELKDKLLQYKQVYAGYITRNVPLTDDENKMIGELVKGNGLGEEDLKLIEEDLLAYKKNFYLSGFQPGKELSADEETALAEFIAKYNLDAKLFEELAQKFMEYRMVLSKS